MKTQYVLCWINSYYESERDTTRERVAYLIRAARSRRTGNVLRTGHCFRLLDCGVRLSPR